MWNNGAMAHYHDSSTNQKTITEKAILMRMLAFPYEKHHDYRLVPRTVVRIILILDKNASLIGLLQATFIQ